MRIVYMVIAASMAVGNGCSRSPSTGENETRLSSEERRVSKKAAAAEAAPKSAAEQREDQSRIRWLEDEPTARRQSSSSHKPLLIDFAAEWCAPCQDMEEKTFRDPALAALISKSYLALKVDVTEMKEAHAALMKRYGVEQLPVIVVLSAEGKELQRWTDFVEATAMRKTLQDLIQ